MSKAEELAKEEYPSLIGTTQTGIGYNMNSREQEAFVKGYNSSQSEIDELTKEVERLMKERDNSLKEKMYFNRMKELVSKVAYDSEHYTQKTYEVLRNDAIGLLNEYNLTTH